MLKYFREYEIISNEGYMLWSHVNEDGNWYLYPGHRRLSEIGKICNIPEDELLMLKLKYGDRSA